ncbi:hypothetical protein acdb102_33490 [Acidothermaceae bacterium B102]|nr:hypothetical protein acdb102_33490 [Acidothermaceae bacterium B102]
MTNYEHHSPGTVSAAFDAYDDELLLDPRQRAAAKQRHNDLGDALVAVALIDFTFLQGSFRRKTMISPLNDIDMVAVYGQQYQDALMSPGGAVRAFELIKQPIRSKLPSVRFDAGKAPAKALKLTFDDVLFTMDVVVAFEDQASDDVFIANRSSGKWERSGTRRLIKLIGNRNIKTGGKFIHQVRMVKSAVKHSPGLDGHVCGLIIEAVAYDYIDSARPHSEAVATILGRLAEAVGGKILDPADHDDLTAKWTPQDRAAYGAELHRMADDAATALRLEGAGDHNAAINTWRSVLGDPFPEAGPRLSTEAAALAALVGGSVTPARGLSATSVGTQAFRPTRAHRPM